MWFDTKRVILTSGGTDGINELSAFDNALYDSGIADFNLIKVSSIVPSGVPISKFKVGASEVLADGVLAPAVFEVIYSDVPGQKIVSGVGVGIPKGSESKPGIIFTYSSKTSKSDVELVLESMIQETMKRKKFELDFAEYSISEKVVEDRMTCSLSAAVFCDNFILSLFEGKYE